MLITQAPSLPSSINTVERRLIYDFLTLEGTLYDRPSTNANPHLIQETDGAYSVPVVSRYFVKTPLAGYRLVLSISIPVRADAGMQNTGLWNFANTVVDIP